MNLHKIDTHTFCPDILTTGGWALDIGCRGFGFARYLADMGLNVIACEPDIEIVDPCIDRITFERVAVVGFDAHDCMYAHWTGGEGNFTSDSEIKGFDTYRVPCASIKSIMDKYSISQFDIIKMDCEGAEYKIFETIPPRCTKQFTVEFHDFVGRNPCKDNNEEYYAKLAGYIPEYKFVQHKKTPLSATNDIENYWDSLFVLKEYCR